MIFVLCLQGSLDVFIDEYGRIGKENGNDEEEEDDEEMEEDDDKVEAKTGIDRGLLAERILGATHVGGELQFLIKWRGTEICDLVSFDEAYGKCIEVVHNFYREGLALHGEKKDFFQVFTDDVRFEEVLNSVDKRFSSSSGAELMRVIACIFKLQAKVVSASERALNPQDK